MTATIIRVKLRGEVNEGGLWKGSGVHGGLVYKYVRVANILNGISITVFKIIYVFVERNNGVFE